MNIKELVIATIVSLTIGVIMITANYYCNQEKNDVYMEIYGQQKESSNNE